MRRKRTINQIFCLLSKSRVIYINPNNEHFLHFLFFLFSPLLLYLQQTYKMKFSQRVPASQLPVDGRMVHAVARFSQASLLADGNYCSRE